MREDTELKNFPLYCPKCKRETLTEAKNLHINVVKEPDARRRADNAQILNRGYRFFIFEKIN